MRASTWILRSFLRYAYKKSVSESVTLSAKLDSMAALPVSSVESGSVVSGVSINGQSTSFSFPGLGPPDVMESIEYIQTLREQIYTQLGGTPTDLEVYTEAMFQLQPVESVTSDFSGRSNYG